MLNRSQFLDPNAQSVLNNRVREQEERKQMLLRQQKERELKQLETQLFYKKQEVARLNSVVARLRREKVVKETRNTKELNDVRNDERQIKEVESRLQAVESDLTASIASITEKIQKEKQIIAEHERNLAEFEKNKKDIQVKKDREKRTFSESMSRLLFYKKKDEQEAEQIKKNLVTDQTRLHGMEASLKTFSQEVLVLENKIRALRTAFK